MRIMCCNDSGQGWAIKKLCNALTAGVAESHAPLSQVLTWKVWTDFGPLIPSLKSKFERIATAKT